MDNNREHAGLAASGGNVENRLVNSGRSCFQLEFNEQAEGHLVNFYEPEIANEHVFRWSEPVAMVRMNVPANEYEVVIETAGLRGYNCPFRFKLFWNDQLIPRKQLRITAGQIRFGVDCNMFIRNDEQRLTISCKPLSAENGRRKLGMPVKWIRLNQLGEQVLEFANPTKSRSRLWRRNPSQPGFRKWFGLKSPSPNLPIWEMKLPDVVSMLPIETTDSKAADEHPGTIDTVIVSSVEINSRHGTGLLIQYMFEDFGNVATVSSHRCFHGDRVRSAVHHEVPAREMKRHEFYSMVLEWFGDSPPKQAYVVPFFRAELLIAIALADLFGTRICIHVMDDQCLYEKEIPVELMREAIQKANLVLTISPEMKAAYEERFGSRVYILPPIVPESMMLDDRSIATLRPETATDRNSTKRLGARAAEMLQRFGWKSKHADTSYRGILVGNVWHVKWLEMLRNTIADSGCEIDWFANNPDAMMLNGKREELAAAGIHLHDPLWGDDLVKELRRRPYAIMPSGTLDRDEPRENVARLSLPSRVPFVTSVARIPIIVLGSRETAAGRFVTRFDLGAVVDYEAGQFKSAVAKVLDRTAKKEIYWRASQISSAFSARNITHWLWESVKLQQPVDSRFEDVFCQKNPESNVCPTAAGELKSCWHRDDLHRVLRRLGVQGIEPQRIIDVGSTNGSWSRAACQVFTDAHFVMIEPLMSQFGDFSSQHFRQMFRSLDVIEASVSDRNCLAHQYVDSDHNGPMLTNILGERTSLRATNANVVTLDSLAEKNQWSGSTVLRIDVRFAEHLVLAGGMNFINSSVDAIVLELTLNRKYATAKSYREILEMMDDLDFDVVDEFEARRCLLSGRLKQKNVVFAKRKFDKLRATA